MHRYFVIYKPYHVLSQFSKEGNKKTLADFFKVPTDVYPVGRLDYDSEGLLLLTNDRSLNHRLLTPSYKHEREYWVQLEGDITNATIDKLQPGVQISLDGKLYTTLPAIAGKFIQAPFVYERNPPIRYRKEIPTSWIKLILYEGKNRQVRRMTAAVGFPTLRLIRYRIEDVTIEALAPGEMKELSQKEVYRLLFK